MNAPQLRLSPLHMLDLPNVMRWVNDREVMQYFATHQRTITWDEERQYMEQLLSSKNDVVFSIFAGEEYIGQCSLNAIYWPARNARMFLVILPEHQHKGYGKEVIRLLLNHAFKVMALHKVWLIVRKDNRAAQAMYLRQGFFFEGTLLDEYCVNGQYYDMVRMSVLDSEPTTTVRKDHLDELLTRSNRLHDLERTSDNLHKVERGTQ